MGSSAAWAAIVDSADWEAAAVFLAIILALAAAAWHGWQAPDALYNRYRDDRARTKAAIDVDRILPELALLIATVNQQVARAVARDMKEPVTTVRLEAAVDVGILQDQLQWRWIPSTIL